VFFPCLACPRPRADRGPSGRHIFPSDSAAPRLVPPRSLPFSLQSFCMAGLASAFVGFLRPSPLCPVLIFVNAPEESETPLDLFSSSSRSHYTLCPRVTPSEPHYYRLIEATACIKFRFSTLTPLVPLPLSINPKSPSRLMLKSMPFSLSRQRGVF